MGEVLIEEGYISQTQLENMLERQKADKKKQRIGEILVQEGIVSENQILSALSKRLNVEFVEFANQIVDVEAVKEIPKTLAVKYNLLAVSHTDAEIVIIMSDPLDFYAIEDIKLVVNKYVSVKIGRKAEIEKAIQYWYAEIDAHRAADSATEKLQNIAMFETEDLMDTDSDTPAVTLANTALYKAYSIGASDIHFEPFEDKTIVRVRVDGQMIDFLTLPAAVHNSLITRIKILASLDIAEKRLPQDGHFKAMLSDAQINVRVSIFPTIHGEKAVLRFLNRSEGLDNAQTFGMVESDYDKFVKILSSPHGIIYITGPTGSGKTTTLYMALEALSKRNVNISTIEDPVERNLPGINQTQTNVLAGLTFDTGLRSLLRQDPDIIMVGETRDSETASIAVRAALTGHLVLSTLHTNDAVSAIARLVDMGVEEYMVANSLVGVVAQRLVKKICPNCKESYEAGENEKLALGQDVTTLYRGRGCPLCNGTGYKGRIAVHEILTVDRELRNLISKKQSVETIENYLFEKGKLTRLSTGMANLVKSGVSTFDEYLKLTYFVD